MPGISFTLFETSYMHFQTNYKIYIGLTHVFVPTRTTFQSVNSWFFVYITFSFKIFSNESHVLTARLIYNLFLIFDRVRAVLCGDEWNKIVTSRTIFLFNRHWTELGATCIWRKKLARWRKQKDIRWRIFSSNSF